MISLLVFILIFVLFFITMFVLECEAHTHKIEKFFNKLFGLN